MLCGMSLNMPMLIVARVLQGAGGGGMQPLAQSILLESFPQEKHGKAMAAFGVGVVVAPIIGPTLGGWITDSYTWRWIFYINLPVGLLALFMTNLYIEDPPYLRHAFRGAIDSLGFGLMAVWLGAMQLVLDKGQEADWFEASWICWLTALSAAAFLGFVARELLARDPIVQLRALHNRNFGIGTVDYRTAWHPALRRHGVSASFSADRAGLFGDGQRPGREPARPGLRWSPCLWWGFSSIASTAASCSLWVLEALVLPRWLLSRINLGISMSAVAWPNFFNGFSGGFIFVPLTTLAMGRLRKQEMGNAAGIYNLVRNVGGSIGIAALTTAIVRGTQTHQSYLGAHLTASSPVADGDDPRPDGKIRRGRRRRGDRASRGAGRGLQQPAAAVGGSGLRG